MTSHDRDKEVASLPDDVKRDRKFVELFTGRLATIYRFETPGCLGLSYASFYINFTVLCDLLQIYFNVVFCDPCLPYVIKTFRG